MNPPPAPGALRGLKAEVIQRSLDCQVAGCLGLVPLIGLPAGVWVIHEFLQVNRLGRETWNPARPQLVAGLVGGLAGIFLTILLAGVVALFIVDG